MNKERSFYTKLLYLNKIINLDKVIHKVVIMDYNVSLKSSKVFIYIILNALSKCVLKKIKN